MMLHLPPRPFRVFVMNAKAYSYIRFSTKDQIKGDSLRRQTEGTAAWCKQHGVELVDSYRDLGISAFKGANAETGALKAFLTLAEDGRIAKGSYLIVESLDRLSRQDILKALKLFLQLIDAGIVLVTLSDGRVYEGSKINTTDLIISISVMSRANDESKIKSERVAAAWMNKRRNAGTVPLTARCVGWLQMKGDRKGFDVLPDRAAVVQRIFELAKNGAGANSIGKTLRREKHRPFGKAPVWHTSYVKKILDNRAVIGEFSPATRRNGEVKFQDAIPGYYPAVVSKELFATVQQMRKTRPSVRGRSSFNVFSGITFDRETGSSMAYVNKNRAKGWHYLVPNAALLEKAKYTTWQYDRFLESFLTLCHKAALAKPASITASNGELASAKMDLETAEQKIGRLVDFLANGTSAGVESKLVKLEADKAALQSKIADLESATIAAPKQVSKVDWQDSAALRENLRATVKRITVDNSAKSFKAEFFDGRTYTFKQDDDKVTISEA